MAIIPVAAARLAINAAKGAAGELALRAARQGICNAYKSDPGWYTNSPSALGRDVGRVASLAMDNLCDDQPMPPPRQVPFQGGQCGFDYDVTFIQIFKNGNPSTSFVRRRAGAIGGIIAGPIGGNPGTRYEWNYGMTAANPRGTREVIVDATDNFVTVTIGSIVKVGTAIDNCGNPYPVDPPSAVGPSVKFDINMPDLRFSPNANIVVPVAIFKPTIVVNADLSVNFNMNIDVGGQKFIFDGDEFRTGADIQTNLNIDFSSVTTAITNSQTNINNNTNTQNTNTQTNINNNTNTQRTNINNNTNTAVANSQTNINTNTNTQLTSVQTNINSSTSTSITNSTNTITNSINSLSLSLTAKIDAIALVLGIVNANLNLALNLLGQINLKPDCPPPILPPGNPDVDDITKPEEPKTGNNPKIQAVTIQLTVNPKKAQWGGGNGAPDKQIAGWFAWKVPGYGFTPQQAINYSTSTFIRPPNVSGYAYTLTNSAKGFAIEHTLK